MIKRFSTFAIAAAGALLIGLGAVAAQTQTAPPAAPETHNHAQEPPSSQSGSPDMTAMQHEMAEMKAASEQIAGLVTQMNAATGDAKIALLAQVVTALAGQHMMMQQHMMRHEQMMPMMGRGEMMKKDR